MAATPVHSASDLETLCGFLGGAGRLVIVVDGAKVSEAGQMVEVIEKLQMQKATEGVSFEVEGRGALKRIGRVGARLVRIRTVLGLLLYAPGPGDDDHPEPSDAEELVREIRSHGRWLCEVGQRFMNELHQVAEEDDFDKELNFLPPPAPAPAPARAVDVDMVVQGEGDDTSSVISDVSESHDNEGLHKMIDLACRLGDQLRYAALTRRRAYLHHALGTAELFLAEEIAIP